MKIQMKILITGGMGFVGSHLCEELLKEHHKLVIITKSNTKKNNISHILKKIKIVKTDITNFHFVNHDNKNRGVCK